MLGVRLPPTEPAPPFHDRPCAKISIPTTAVSSGESKRCSPPEATWRRRAISSSAPSSNSMATAVAKTLRDGRHLVVEAGTGVGKSLAYLAPAVLYALENKKKAVVSTHTINLQEQLDLQGHPHPPEACGRGPFEAALFKGRQNYLCPRRLSRARQQATELFTGPEQAAVGTNPLLEPADRGWLALSDLPREPDHNVWQQVCSEAHVCTPKTCGTRQRLLSSKPRGARCKRANVVVLNHALFFVLLGAAMADGTDPLALRRGGGGERGTRPPTMPTELNGFLFDDDFVVFDEAHTVEATARAPDRPGRVAVRAAERAPAALPSAHQERALHRPAPRRRACARDGRTASRTWRHFFQKIDSALRTSSGGAAGNTGCASRASYRIQPRAVAGTPLRVGQRKPRRSRSRTTSRARELGDLGRRLLAAREGITVFIDQVADQPRVLGRAHRQDREQHQPQRRARGPLRSAQHDAFPAGPHPWS